MDEKRKAILVNVSPEKDVEKPLKELALLAETADYEVVGVMTQRKEKPDKAYYIGTGKLKELKDATEALQADTVIFDNDVTGSQFNNLEMFLSVDVIDRATLILEIFARHATSAEGKLQVELARKKHSLPRVLGQGAVLSRQGGGGAAASGPEGAWYHLFSTRFCAAVSRPARTGTYIAVLRHELVPLHESHLSELQSGDAGVHAEHPD